MACVRLCFCAAIAIALVARASLAQGDEALRGSAALGTLHLWLGLGAVTPRLELDDDLPEIELVLDPDLRDDLDEPAARRVNRCGRF